MAKLILTTSHSGSGHLKRERIAQRVIPITHRLVWGAVPQVTDEANFLIERGNLSKRPGEDWAYWDEWEEPKPSDKREIKAEDTKRDAAVTPAVWTDLMNLCAGYAEVELWIDPDPNAQLIQVQLLSWFSHYPELIAKIILVHADSPLSEGLPNGTRDLEQRQPVQSDHLRLAIRAWDAFTHSTPEQWFNLLQTDLSCLPHLRQGVWDLLEELPDASTALTATESTLLALIPPEGATPFELFPGHQKRNTRRVHGYWETGLLLDRLASYPEAAVMGLDVRPFTLEMHDDEGRFSNYLKCIVSLAESGRRLLEGRDNFARHRQLCRWWGGVKLSNENLWKWDPQALRLVRPS